MKFIEKKEKFDFMLQQIESENTGTADEFCRKLCVSERTLFRMLADAREIGHQISYCTRRKTYHLIHSK
ncbi:MAG TPA: hypothetical protein PK855_10670 [Bacteroidales bacterium]|nr:hypothetical protein [Bacteroidales bacterium]